MKKKIIFKGAATALVTPFDALGEIDFTALGELIERQISEGIDALVICGTTGESATLTDTERRRCISFAVEKAEGRVPIIAGTGSNNAEYAKELSCFASSEGVDGILVVTPYYNKATEKGMKKYYLSIAESATSPIIIYNVPSRTGCKVTMPVYRKLAEHENIAAVKGSLGGCFALCHHTRGAVGLALGLLGKRRFDASNTLHRRSGCDIGALKHYAAGDA